MADFSNFIGRPDPALHVHSECLQGSFCSSASDGSGCCSVHRCHSGKVTFRFSSSRPSPGTRTTADALIGPFTLGRPGLRHERVVEFQIFLQGGGCEHPTLSDTTAEWADRLGQPLTSTVSIQIGRESSVTDTVPHENELS